MSAALVEHGGGWTIADVEELPDTGMHTRYEILSTGVLTVSPAPGTQHQRASRRLAHLIEKAADEAEADVEVLEGINVELPGERLTTPDVVVVDAEFAATNPVRYPAAKVVAIVEIVSPGSEPQDRLVKPQLYAEAGIGTYWRFELSPSPHIVATSGEGSVTAPAGKRTTLPAPFPVTLDPGELPEQ